MKRVLLRTVLGVLALLLLLGALVTGLLASQAGSRWLLEQVPGLEVEGFSGRLGGAWQAEHLRWQSGERLVQVDAPMFAWRPACLLRGTLCIDRLRAGEVLLQLPPSEAPADEDPAPFSLPDLDLPFGLELGEVSVGRILFNGAEELTALNLVAHWNAQGLQLDALQVQRDDLRANLHGQLSPQGDWPLSLTGEVELPAPDAQPWAVELEVAGELKRRVTLAAGSAGYLQATLRGWLEPLSEDLPASLVIETREFKAAASLPDTLTVQRLRLSAEGDLAEGFTLAGQGALAAAEGPIALNLSGHADTRGARLEGLELRADAEHRVGLVGTADWSDGLSADLQLDWQDFPWQRLYPLDSIPVQLRQMQAQLQYRDGRYLGNFASTLDGPAGRFQLSSPVSGDLAEVHLPSLKLVAGQGSVEGQLGLGFADALNWKTQLQVSQFDPSYWLAELPGRLSGPLQSEGSLRDGQLQATAEVGLQGQLRRQPAQLAISASGAGEAWTLQRLDVQLGDNRVQGSAGLNDALTGQLDIALRRLDQLWPGLRGAISGDLSLAGNLKAPQGRLALKGSSLAFAETRVQSLSLDAKLDAAQQGTLDLRGDGLAQGELALGRLRVQGSGDAHRQQASLNLEGPTATAELALAGDLASDAGGWRWNGQLQRAHLAGYGQDWRLQNAARLTRRADGRIEFAAHCWVNGEASLCGDDQILAPEPRLRYRLRDFPLQSLAQLLPDDLRWEGQLNADLSLDLPAAGPTGSVRVDAGSGQLRMHDGADWVDFDYRALALDMQLRPQRVTLDARFDGDRLGQLQLQANIDPRQDDKPLDGRFQLSGLQLQAARPFLPMVEELQGSLNGDGTLSGTLQAPQVRGQVRLSEGLIAGGDLPTRFEDLQLQANILGQRVQLEGGWKSGEQGRGSLGGAIDWADGLDVDLSITGHQLPVDVEPYAELEVAPDLRVSMRGGALTVAGTVRVPRGSIIVRQLPASTVKVSQDTVIVGEEQGDAPAGLTMAMDIDVVVGEQKLTFSGFGLTAEIAGQVHIGDNLETQGELNLNKGRYRAYGQRLTIRRARLLFTGLISQPYLDVEAVRVVDDVTAGLRLSGSVVAPSTEVFSEPAMSQEQALSYLVLGRPLGGDSGDSNLLAQAALGLGLAGSSRITAGLAQNLGIENFQLDTEGSGNSTSVVASGSLTDRLSLRYGVGVFEPATTIGLRYELTRRLFLEAASGLASSLDLFYRRDF